MGWKLGIVVALFPIAASAQVMPTLTDTAPYTLALPYLEYTAPGGATKSGFAVNLKSSNFPSFTLDTSSLKTQTAFSNAVNAPQVSLSGTQFLLTVPYLSFTSGGVGKAFSVTLSSTDLKTFTALGDSIKELPVLAAPGSIAVTNASTQTVGSTTFSSSTKLTASWTAPTGYVPDHYRIYASETVGNTNVSFTALAADTSATLTGLKSSTPYSVVVKACKDKDCLQSGTAPAVTGKTSEEVWQVRSKGVQGSGNTWNTAQNIISDGNTKAWALAYGSGAGSGLDGTVRLFYDPNFDDPAQKGVKIGYTTSPATTDPFTVSSFMPATGYGLRYIDPQNAVVKNNYMLATSMPVPLSAAMGGKIRLFFEFAYTGFGAAPRGIYYLDSQDGYAGLDYNKGSATVCSTDAEFAVGGNCAPTLAMGKGFTGVDAAMQFKIGYPTLTDWRWNGEPGTFMLFGLFASPGSCPTNKNGMGYAQWDGDKWVVSHTNGCPNTWDGMNAPVPLHLGGARYKVYYGHGDISDQTCGIIGTKKVLYADGAISGNPTTVEFEDWEAKAGERDISFLWPDGSALDSCSEQKFDDFTVYMPTFSTDYQVMYMVNENLWLAMAVLLNP